MESTYGDRTHRSLHETAVEGRKIIAQAVEDKAKILVPIFAVGRTQLLLYLLAGAFQRGTLPKFPIYLDSPMAIEATKVLAETTSCSTKRPERWSLRASCARTWTSPRHAQSPKTRRHSRMVSGPCLIMAGAGMCTGGRIIHHLRHNLPIEGTVVLMVGYQSANSLGRRLVDGDKEVRIFGERIPVRASVHTMGGFSAHADQQGLLDWYGAVAPSKPRNDHHARARPRPRSLSELIRTKYGMRTECPNLGT
jgi:metallo-beta-lactamase family protein